MTIFQRHPENQPRPYLQIKPIPENLIRLVMTLFSDVMTCRLSGDLIEALIRYPRGSDQEVTIRRFVVGGIDGMSERQKPVKANFSQPIPD